MQDSSNELDPRFSLTQHPTLAPEQPAEPVNELADTLRVQISSAIKNWRGIQTEAQERADAELVAAIESMVQEYARSLTPPSAAQPQESGTESSTSTGHARSNKNEGYTGI